MVAQALGIGFQVATLGTWQLSSAHLQAPCSLGQADLVPLAESKGTDPMIGKAFFFLPVTAYDTGVEVWGNSGDPKVLSSRGLYLPLLFGS